MAEAPADRGHARLAPSSASRWSACPGSVVLEAALPEPPSSGAAMEGTAAHELAAHCLGMGFDTKRFLGRKINVFGKETATIFLAKDAPGGPGIYDVTPEMAEHVLDYVKLVRTTVDGTKGEMAVERRVYAKSIHEDVHGTADAIVYRPDTKTLHIFDLKYGRGVVVEVEGNKQLAIYASGARALKHNRDIEEIQVHIFQPRAPHKDGAHRTLILTPKDLDAAEIELREAAARVDRATALAGKGSDGWEAAFLSPGDHCMFCKVKACTARAAAALEVAKTEFGDTTALQAPESMSSDELATVLAKARQIQHWVKAVEAHCHAQATAGEPPTGFKLVGGRTSRAWDDEEKLVAKLPFFVSVNVKGLYEDPKLLSPAKLEKLLPKDERASLAPFITKKQAATQLVPVDDARPAIKPDASSEFGSVELSE